MVACATQTSAALSLYQVGNSLTVDSQFQGTTAMLAERLGVSVEHGYHVRGNSTLDFMWNNPTATNTATSHHGDHTVALTGNHWDYLTLQSYPLGGVTLGQDLARIEDFVGAADQGSGGATEIIVYGSWPPNASGDWDRWDDPATDSPGAQAAFSASYHDLLYDRVEERFPGRVRLASAGKVVATMRDRIIAGDSPILRAGHLYRDHIHMSFGVGRFTASTTVQTSILGRSQVGQPVPTDVWDESNLTDEQAYWIQLTAWEVLLNDPRSGVTVPDRGDYDGDGDVDFADLKVIDLHWGSTTSLLADGNGDGVVDASDEAVWLEERTERVNRGDFDGDGQVDFDDKAIWDRLFGEAVLLPGDVDLNGIVDAADYTRWRDALAVGAGAPGGGAVWAQNYADVRLIAADANGDGVYNTADYTVWRDAFSAAPVASATTPEPSSLLLATVFVTMAWRRAPR